MTSFNDYYITRQLNHGPFKTFIVLFLNHVQWPLIVNHEKSENGSGPSDSDLPRCSPYLVRDPIHTSDLAIVTPAAHTRPKPPALCRPANCHPILAAARSQLQVLSDRKWILWWGLPHGPRRGPVSLGAAITPDGAIQRPSPLRRGHTWVPSLHPGILPLSDAPPPNEDNL